MLSFHFKMIHTLHGGLCFLEPKIFWVNTLHVCYVAHEINKTPTHVVTMRERGSKYRYVMLIGKCLQEYLKFKRHPHCAHVKLYRYALILYSYNVNTEPHQPLYFQSIFCTCYLWVSRKTLLITVHLQRGFLAFFFCYNTLHDKWRKLGHIWMKFKR